MKKIEKTLYLGKVSCRIFTVLSSVFKVKNQKSKTDLEKCYQYSVSIEISVDLKVCFSLGK